MALLAAALILALQAMPFRAAAADQFEDDDAWTDASTIAIDAADAQYHDFHDEGDQDWVKFEVLFASSYEIYTLRSMKYISPGRTLTATASTTCSSCGPTPAPTPGTRTLMATA
jgi:hypothetical protein